MAPDAAPMNSDGDHRMREGVRRLLGHDQADQIEVEGRVDPPADESTDQRRRHAFGAERSAPSPAELEHEGRADEGDPHQRRHARRAAADGGGTQKPPQPRPRSPRQSPAATPRYAAGASVPIAPPEPTVARIASRRSGASRHGSRSSVARAVHELAADVRPDRAWRKRPPWARLRLRAGLSEPVQHQHGERQPEQRHHHDEPGGLAGDEVHPGLEHQGHAHDDETTDQPAQQCTEAGGARCSTNASACSPAPFPPPRQSAHGRTGFNFAQIESGIASGPVRQASSARSCSVRTIEAGRHVLLEVSHGPGARDSQSDRRDSRTAKPARAIWETVAPCRAATLVRRSLSRSVWPPPIGPKG